MSTKVEFSITKEDHEAFLRKYQEILQKRAPEGTKVTLSDTALAIFGQGVSRVKATSRYASKQGPRSPKASKAKAPKAAKPKGPLARKQASKAKAPAVRKAKTPAAAPAPVAEKPAETGTASAVLD